MKSKGETMVALLSDGVKCEKEKLFWETFERSWQKWHNLAKLAATCTAMVDIWSRYEFCKMAK